MRDAKRMSCLLMAVWLGGCANVPRDAEFSEVQRLVAERTGQDVQWIRGDAADQAVAARVRAMLEEDELAAEEAVQVALLNNRSLQATYEDLMIAQTDLVAAGLLANPIFDAEVRFAEGGGGEGLELSVAQSFLGIFQIPLRKKIAAERFEATKLRVTGEVLELADEVRQTWYRLVAGRQLQELRQTALAAADAAYELAQRLHEAGNITDLELQLERAQYEQAKLELAAAEYAVVAQREALNARMGLWGEAAMAWQAPVRLPAPPTSGAQAVESLESEVIAANLELGALRHRIESAAHTLGLRRTFGLIPEFEAGVTGDREPEGEWAVGPTLSLPIPLFDQGQPGAAVAAADLRRARAEYYAKAVRLRATTRAAWALVQNAENRVAYYQQVVLPLRNHITGETQLQYNAMQIGAFQLLQARRQEVETAQDFIEALRAYWMARSTLNLLRHGGTARVDTIDAEPFGAAMPDDAGTSTGDH